MMNTNPITEAITLAGGVGKLAALLGVKHPAVIRWRALWDDGRTDAIPASRAIEIEAVTGIPRSHLRPDLWGENSRTAA